MTTAPMPFVSVVIGDKVDLPFAQPILDTLARFKVKHEVRVASAHHSPERLVNMLRTYESMTEAERPCAVITVAGLSNGLSAAADTATSLPVIACPVLNADIAGADVFSSLRCPPGAAPMVVLDPTNAALAAVKIAAVAHPASGLSAKVNAVHLSKQSQLAVDDRELKTQAYLPQIKAGFGHTFDETSLTLSPRKGADKVERYIGKVRDRYDDGEQVILITTDRLSAFDRKLACIPFKGQVLNLVSRWWFAQTSDIIKNHLVPNMQVHPNVTVSRRCTPFPIEFVMRGYITGSSGTAMWTHYKKGVRSYCGIELPDGLKQHQKLSENMITPTTKSDEHDELISPEKIVADGWMSESDWDFCAAKAKAIFARGQELAAKHGLILVDTKYEFGKDLETGEILLIDEIHTPDSSRYWIASTYEERMARGESPDNIDKEFVRLWYAANCDPYKDEVLPDAPHELLCQLSRRYIQLYEMITGLDFPFPTASGVSPNAAIQAALDQALAA